MILKMYIKEKYFIIQNILQKTLKKKTFLSWCDLNNYYSNIIALKFKRVFVNILHI